MRRGCLCYGPNACGPLSPQLIPKKGNAKECSNYRTIALISHASKVMLKILQARLQQYVNCELPDAQAGVRKGRGTRDQIANIHRIMEKAREFQKNIYFCFVDYAKAQTGSRQAGGGCERAGRGPWKGPRPTVARFPCLNTYH